MPMLIASDDAYLVNTSSVNGFWATLGPGVPNSAYSTAKFAVKGFSESLIEDLRVNAPHVKVAVVMPGHIGTDIVANTRRYHGRPEPDAMSDAELEEARTQFVERGLPLGEVPPDQVRGMLKTVEEMFRTAAPLSAAGAATVILDGVRSGRWRILVGDDAERLDSRVRAEPEAAYDPTVSLSSLGLGRQNQPTDG